MKNLRKTLEKLEEQNFKIAKQNSKLWKGKKIVSEKEWRKISGDSSFLFLKYVPDTFLTTPLLRYIDYNKISREKIQQWAQDYYEYLEHSKNPEYGRIKCKNCILNQDNEIRSSIRNVVLKGLATKFSANTEFPCTTVNMFECPYEKEKDTLMFAGGMGEVIYNALLYAYTTTQQPGIVFHVDFEAGLADRQMPIYDPMYTIETKLIHLRMPKVPLQGLLGTCSILTDQNLLDSLIEQYIESLEDGNFKRILSPITDVNPEWVKNSKDAIIRFFMKIKEHINPEELHEPSGHTFLREMEKSEKHRDVFGKCSLCNNSGNIHCINCDSWTCITHWRKHGLEQHNYTMKLEPLKKTL